MEKQPSKSVYVKNISASASEKTVTDFFGFCGKITSITLLKQEGVAEQEAIVEFQDANAAKTAILLSNAMIVDKLITVTYYHPEEQDTKKETTDEPQPQVTSVKKEGEIENKPNIPPATERSNTSVVASLLAAGYTLGSDAIQKAVEYDEQYEISATIKDQAEAIKGKVSELDATYGISTTASQWATSASSFFGGFGLSEKAAMVRRGSSNLVRTVGESEVVTTTTATLSGVKEVVVEVAGVIKDEAVKLMDEPAVKSYIKVVTEKIHEGTEAVKVVAEEVGKGVKEVVDETSTLIASKVPHSSPDDDALLVVLEEEEKPNRPAGDSETVNPPEPKDN